MIGNQENRKAGKEMLPAGSVSAFTRSAFFPAFLLS
jgi:hypothetical protein